MRPTGLKSFDELVEQFRRFPSLGGKSAQRIVSYILSAAHEDVNALVQALSEVKKRIQFCEQCFAYSETALCLVCSDTRRDQGLICVVEHPIDVFAVEQSAQFRGLYHVLHGRLSPLDGMGPETLKIDDLIKRVSGGETKEVILATNPDVEGDATALYLARILKRHPFRVSRIAMGIPLGGHLEYTDQVTLGRAITERRVFSDSPGN